MKFTSTNNKQTEVQAPDFEDARAVGDMVRMGDLIGYEASIGNSTGCHTHFILRVNGTAVDPANYLEN